MLFLRIRKHNVFRHFNIWLNYNNSTLIKYDISALVLLSGVIPTGSDGAKASLSAEQSLEEGFRFLLCQTLLKLLYLLILFVQFPIKGAK